MGQWVQLVTFWMGHLMSHDHYISSALKLWRSFICAGISM